MVEICRAAWKHSVGCTDQVSKMNRWEEGCTAYVERTGAVWREMPPVCRATGVTGSRVAPCCGAEWGEPSEVLDLFFL